MKGGGGVKENLGETNGREKQMETLRNKPKCPVLGGKQLSLFKQKENTRKNKDGLGPSEVVLSGQLT